MKNKKTYRGMILLVIFLVLVAALIIFYKGRMKSHGLSEGGLDVSVRWMGNDYFGSYTGEIQNNLPEGEGAFISADGKFQYTGEWKAGVFNGEGEMEYDGVKKEQGTYADGRRDGIVRIFYEDNTNSECIYEEGVAYGREVIYDESGNQLSSKLHVNGITTEELSDQAILLDREVLAQQLYSNRYIRVEGVIEYIYHEGNTVYFRMSTEDIGMIVGSYQNQDGIGAHQAIVPNMNVGDSVSLYGYYAGNMEYTVAEDEEYSGYTFLAIDLLYGELIQESDDLTDYEKLAENPYSFYNLRISGQFNIDRVKQDGEVTYVFVTSDNGEEWYVLSFKEISELFLQGTQINVAGFFDGQYKHYLESEESPDGETEVQQEEGTEVRLYPLIRVEEYELEYKSEMSSDSNETDSYDID